MQRPLSSLAAWSLAALLALTLLVSCRPPSDRVSGESSADGAAVTVALLTRPARVGPASIEVTIRDGDDAVTGASVRVTGDMTHAGMLPVVADATEVEDGVYRSDGFAFDMAGDWVITVDVTLPGGGRDQRTLAVSVGR
jgi:hypothetical protein